MNSFCLHFFGPTI